MKLFDQLGKDMLCAFYLLQSQTVKYGSLKINNDSIPEYQSAKYPMKLYYGLIQSLLMLMYGIIGGRGAGNSILTQLDVVKKSIQKIILTKWLFNRPMVSLKLLLKAQDKQRPLYSITHSNNTRRKSDQKVQIQKCINALEQWSAHYLASKLYKLIAFNSKKKIYLNLELPQCVVCHKGLAAESVLPNKLKWHLETNHSHQQGKPRDFFVKKLRELNISSRLCFQDHQLLPKHYSPPTSLLCCQM